MKFNELEIREELMRATSDMGFEEMTPIQEEAITEILAGRDIIGQAQTGTGKTAAFGIPVIEKIDREDRNLQAVILCPTRELAVQVSDELHRLCKYMHGVRVVPIFGGQEIVKQIRALKAGAQILVGTPGRTLDHMRRKTVPFDHVKMVVLDEADEMLNMGFREDIETVLSGVPQERQTVLFSATMPGPILEIARNYQQDAKIIRVIKKELTVDKIAQYYYNVRQKDKLAVLIRLLDVYDPRLSIVFCNTKRQVDELAENLRKNGYQAEGLHGDMNQAARMKVMNDCRQKRTNILVATDVAARGIDLEQVDAVFNYDLPLEDEYYVHRIGRTGRAGCSGASFSFVSGREIYKLREIERYCRTKIEKKEIPGGDEILERKIARAVDQARETVKNRNLEHVSAALEELVENGDLSLLELASALLYESAGLDIQEIASPEEEPERRSRKTGTGGRGKAAPKGMARLFLNAGKRDRIETKDILGAVAGEADVPGAEIGAIDMYDNYSFVDVPELLAEKIVRMLSGKKIRGRQVRLERSGEGGSAGSRGRESGRGSYRGNAGDGRSSSYRESAGDGRYREGRGGAGRDRSSYREDGRGRNAGRSGREARAKSYAGARDGRSRNTAEKRSGSRKRTEAGWE